MGVRRGRGLWRVTWRAAVERRTALPLIRQNGEGYPGVFLVTVEALSTIVRRNHS